jgi:ribonuclease HI
MLSLITDGSSAVTGGLGSAAQITQGRSVRTISFGVGKLPTGRSNCGELCAVALGLMAIRPGLSVTIITDSRNVIGWLYGYNLTTQQPDPTCRFQRNNPTIAALVDLIEPACARLDITWEWIRGHQGHPGNEWADTASRAIRHTAMLAQQPFLVTSAFTYNGLSIERPLDLGSLPMQLYTILMGRHMEIL